MTLARDTSVPYRAVAAWSILGDRVLASIPVREMFEYDSWTIPGTTPPMIMCVIRKAQNRYGIIYLFMTYS